MNSQKEIGGKGTYPFVKYLEYYHFLNRDRNFQQSVKSTLFKTLLLFVNLFLPAGRPILCDILAVGTCDVDIRHSFALWEKLKEKGYRVETIIPKKGIAAKVFEIFLAGRLDIDRHIPTPLFYEAAYARYLLTRFFPKIICCFYSAGLIPSFLRQGSISGIKTVYIPHGVLNSSANYSSLDFDYYFVFGEGSLNCLRENRATFGQTKVVKTGSPMVSATSALPVSRLYSQILFLSSWDLDSSTPGHAGYRKDFEIVVEWAKHHPEYALYIKLHPLEKGDYVREAVAGTNITIFDKSVSLRVALSKVSLVITMYSAASIEAALMKRPLVVVNHRGYDPDSTDFKENDEILRIESYFPKRARTSEELQDRISNLVTNYDHYLKNCENYVSYHLEHTADSIDYMTAAIGQILDGKESFPYIEMGKGLNGAFNL